MPQQYFGELTYFIPIPGSNERVQVTLTGIPYLTFGHMQSIRQRLSPSELFELFQFSNAVKNSLEMVKRDIPDLNVELAFQQFWEIFPKTLPVPPDIEIKNEADRVLALTYTLLRERAVSHTEAAQFASSILGRTIKPDTWRKRVDRWAEAHGLPKVELKRTKS